MAGTCVLADTYIHTHLRCTCVYIPGKALTCNTLRGRIQRKSSQCYLYTYYFVTVSWSFASNSCNTGSSATLCILIHDVMLEWRLECVHTLVCIYNWLFHSIYQKCHICTSIVYICTLWVHTTWDIQVCTGHKVGKTVHIHITPSYSKVTFLMGNVKPNDWHCVTYLKFNAE